MAFRKMLPHDKTAITFELVTSNTGTRGIKCLVCEKTSYNTNDLEYKYCGGCHQFHPVRNYYKTADRPTR